MRFSCQAEELPSTNFQTKGRMLIATITVHKRKRKSKEAEPIPVFKGLGSNPTTMKLVELKDSKLVEMIRSGSSMGRIGMKEKRRICIDQYVKIFEVVMKEQQSFRIMPNQPNSESIEGPIERGFHMIRTWLRSKDLPHTKGEETFKNRLNINDVKSEVANLILSKGPHLKDLQSLQTTNQHLRIARFHIA